MDTRAVRSPPRANCAGTGASVVAVAAATLALILAGCGDAQRPQAAGEAAAPLETLVVRAERTPLERELDGVIEAVNQGTVSAQTAGRIAEILYDVNDFVPAGAVIVRLRATEQRSGLMQADAALKEATAREAEAQARYARIADMHARKVVPKAMLDEATANRDAAVARLAATRAARMSAQEGVGYTEIRAPYAGVVTKRHVQVGEAVAPGTPIVSGLSLQYLRVTADVPQSVVEQVRRLRKAAVYVDGRRIEATRLTIFPEASAGTSTFRVRLDLPENAADLYPGMFVKAGFVVGEAERLLVPATALVERSEVTGLYVVDAGNRTSLRLVRLGHRFGDRVEVLAGLSPGDRIALDPLAAMRQLRRAAPGPAA